MATPENNIQYSPMYCDDLHEYRHVKLPMDLAKTIPRNHLLTETEWRNIGVQQSTGWVHFMMHRPEPNILIFKRLKTRNPQFLQRQQEAQRQQQLQAPDQQQLQAPGQQQLQQPTGTAPSSDTGTNG